MVVVDDDVVLFCLSLRFGDKAVNSLCMVVLSLQKI